MHIYGFSTFFFFPEQYRLHAKQGDAASAGNFSHSHHSTLNELFFCVFWKRFVSNGGSHYTLLPVSMNSVVWICWFVFSFKSFFLKVKLVASLNLARVASFPFLGILPMISAVPGLHLSQPDAATMLLGEKKRRFIGEVSAKWVHGIAVVLVGWWLITKVWRARLDIVCVCVVISLLDMISEDRDTWRAPMCCLIGMLPTSTTTTLRIASWAQRWLSAIGRWAWRSLK